MALAADAGSLVTKMFLWNENDLIWGRKIVPSTACTHSSGFKMMGSSVTDSPKRERTVGGAWLIGESIFFGHDGATVDGNAVSEERVPEMWEDKLIMVMTPREHGAHEHLACLGL